MAGEDVLTRSASELSLMLHQGQLSPVELVQGYLDRIERLDGGLHSYITICADEALAEAKKAEAELASGRSLGPLHGLPISLKDQLHARGVRTTAGSRILDVVPDEDSTVVARLKEAGAIILGKLNMSEFALGGSVEHPFGTPRNPWDVERQPGASSSGSGVAVAASLCAAAIGEDTGGSIRSPSAWCGITGIRPTWGRVSRYGLLPASWSMDTAGPMAKTVEDCAMILRVIAGRDPKDPYTSRRPPPEFTAVGDLQGVRIGLITESIDADVLDPEVKAAMEEAVRVLEGAGAVVEGVSAPLHPVAGLISNAIADAESAFVHRDWLRTRPQDYDFANRRRLLATSLIPAGLYQKAQRFRVLMRRQLMEILERVDVLLSPTQAAPPGKIRSDTGLTTKEAVVSQFFGSRSHRSPFNLSGLPAMSTPCGFTSGGLPVGMQLAGRPFDETAVLQAGYAYQQRTGWGERRPPLDG